MEGNPNRDILESIDRDDLTQEAMLYAAGELEAECDDELFHLYNLVGIKGGAKVVIALARCWEYGWGIIKDLKNAIEYYVKAAEQGSFEALERLLNMRYDQTVRTSLENAFRVFNEKADQGGTRVEFNTGFCLYYGIGSSEDKVKARELFLKAADQGCADAVYMLELCRENNHGDGYNGMQGIELLGLASKMGSTEAEYQLGCGYYYGRSSRLAFEQNYEEAAELLWDAMAESHMKSSYFLAWRYCNGEGVSKDLKMAFNLFKKAALQGDGNAQNRISSFYRHTWFILPSNEYPVDLDCYEAVYWSSKAADEGHDSMRPLLECIGLPSELISNLACQFSLFVSAPLWYNIAKECEAGDGVVKDEEKAYNLYELAARFGSIEAKIALGRCYEAGSGVEVDTKEAIHWYEKAAAEGDVGAAECLLNLIQPGAGTSPLGGRSAFAALAGCYEAGSGVARSEGAALLMREFAAANGDVEQARLVIEAYIAGKGSEYRIKFAGEIAGKTPGLSREDYLQFIELFSGGIDELDGALILQNAAAAIRAEALGIEFVLD